jgi:hypothetical protein
LACQRFVIATFVTLNLFQGLNLFEGAVKSKILNQVQDDELCRTGKIWHKKAARSCDGAAF